MFPGRDALVQRLQQMVLGGPTPGSPELGSVLTQNPEAAIPSLAAAGVMPPDLSQVQPGFAPGGGGFTAENALNPLPMSPSPGVGSLPTPTGTPQAQGGGETIPLPQPRPANASSGEATGAGGQQKSSMDQLMDAMKGVKAPPAPETQKISSPPPPRPNALSANPQLLQLIAQGVQGGPNINPLLLGQALGGGGRRY